MNNTKLVPRPQVFSLGGKTSSYTSFISKLEGWKTKCKNLHWAAPKMNAHKLLDEFLVVLSDYQDTVAEGIMGITGTHLGPNDIKGEPSNATNPFQLMKEIKTETINYYKGISSDPLYCGLKSECEDFIQNLNTYDYLFSLCTWNQ